MKKYIEKIIEIAIKVSGYAGSLAILLIVGYLFKESAGIVTQKQIERGYTLALNKNNPVDDIPSFEIKEMFDRKITNWQEVGGADAEIQLFYLNDLLDYFSEDELEDDEKIANALNTIIAENENIIAYVPTDFISEDFHLYGKEINSPITLLKLLKTMEWLPTAKPSPQFGLIPLLLGSLWVSVGAILFAFPLGLMVAIYISELSSARFRKLCKPAIELLAAIPSVVYGFFGLVVIVPFIRTTFNLPVGETALAGSIVLAIMVLPTIISIAEDSLQSVPNMMREASLSLGATQFQTIFRVLIPYAKSGIITAGVLGIGRAIGETMAVLMVTGNASVIPRTFLEPVRTIPATIAAELGETAMGSAHFNVLFLLGAILFLITFLFNLLVHRVSENKNLPK